VIASSRDAARKARNVELSPFVVLRGLAILAIVVPVVYYGLITDSPLPDHRLVVGVNDIVLHFGAFALLTAVALVGSRRFWSPLFCVSAMAVAMEAAQILEPARQVDIRDIASSLTGVAAGAIFALFAGAVHRLIRWN
jgi:hypothetical protein